MSGIEQKYAIQMKWIYYIATYFIIYMSIHPFMTAWVGSITQIYAPIKIWKDILLVIIAVVVTCWMWGAKKIDKSFFTDRLNILIIAYILFTLLLFIAFRSYLNKSGYAGLIFSLRFLVAFLLVRLVLWKYKPQIIHRYLSKISFIVILIGVGLSIFSILQVFVLPVNFLSYFGYDGINTISPISTVDNNPHALRAFATLRGPNELGAYLIIPLVLAVTAFKRNVFRWFYVLSVILMSFAIYLSHSRSAVVGAIIAVSVLGIARFRRKLPTKYLLLIVSGLFITLGILAWMTVSIPSVRLVVLHSSEGDVNLTEGSTGDHFVATMDGIHDVILHPLGHGPGQAGPASFYNSDGAFRIAENYYVQIAQEIGILGLGLFVAICLMIVRRLKSLHDNDFCLAILASFMGISVVAAMLHTWADDPLSYTWWILAAFALATGRNYDQSTKQKTA